MNIVINVAIALVIGGIAAVIAESRGRSPLRWFAIGVLFGFYGIIFLFILPSAKVETPPETVTIPHSEKVSSPTPTDWFYLDQQKNVQGPISLKALKELWDKRLLNAKSWVWNESLIEWNKLENVQVLFYWLNAQSHVETS